MKKRITSLLLSFLIVTISLAQKSAVVTAWNYLNSDELDKAKEAIDNASKNEKSKLMAKTWYYRGLIYQSIYNHDKYSKLDSNPLSVAYDSYIKSLDIDPKSEYVENINKRLVYVAFYKGVEEYKNKKYADAVKSFEYILQTHPNDTASIAYLAYSAFNLKDMANAEKYYTRLININYMDPEPDKSNIYLDFAWMYKSVAKDTVKALEYIQMGIKKYPDANNLLREQVNLYIQTGKKQEAINHLQLAIQKQPNDSLLQYALGNLYDKLAYEAFRAGNKSADEYYAKAESAYKKSIELNPHYFDAYYSLGAMFFNRGAEMANAANNITNDSEYKKAKEKADITLKTSLPYLEKAFDLNQKDKDTLISLKQIYARTGQLEKSNDMKKRLEELH